MFRTIGDGPSSWELLLPPEVLRLPEDLALVDALLDDPVLLPGTQPHRPKGGCSADWPILRRITAGPGSQPDDTDRYRSGLGAGVGARGIRRLGLRRK
jgi:hypothetical protein